MTELYRKPVDENFDDMTQALLGEMRPVTNQTWKQNHHWTSNWKEVDNHDTTFMQGWGRFKMTAGT